MTDELFPPDLVASLAETFKVLGDATRVRILDVLSRRELCVGDIAGGLGLTESAVSHQLRVLRNARLVRQRRAGQLVYYALDDHHVIRLFAQASEHVRERDGDLGLTRPATIAADTVRASSSSPGEGGAHPQPASSSPARPSKEGI
jgi:ArsR family transcriptional regulator